MFAFKFLERAWHHAGKPSEREFAQRLGSYYQRLSAWKKSSERIREAYRILCRARLLSGESWAKFGPELDREFSAAETASHKPKSRE